MAARDKIRAACLEPQVRTLVAAGKSSREIAAELAKAGHKISHETVAKFIREETTSRREAAQSALSADASATVPLITDGLKRLAALAEQHAEKAAALEDFGSAARLITSSREALMSLHKVTVGDDGAAKPDDRPLAPSTLWKVEGDA